MLKCMTNEKKTEPLPSTKKNIVYIQHCLAVLAGDRELTRNINLNGIIDDFASLTAIEKEQYNVTEHKKCISSLTYKSKQMLFFILVVLNSHTSIGIYISIK